MEFNERKITTRHRLEAEIYAAILIKINGAVRKKERKNWKVQHTSGRCGNKNITLTSSSMFTFFSGIKREQARASERKSERTNGRARKKEIHRRCRRFPSASNYGTRRWIFITITRRTWALYSRKRRQKDASAELGGNYGAATKLSEETTARKVNNATIAVDYTLSPLASQDRSTVCNLISLIRALYTKCYKKDQIFNKRLNKTVLA